MIFNLIVIDLFYSTTDDSSGILLPTTNPSDDKTSLNNLQPNNQQTIYYNQVYNQYKADKVQTAVINYEFSVPSLVFDDLSQIFILNFTNQTIVFGFQNDQSFNQSLHWPQNGTAMILQGQCLSSNAHDVILLNGFMYDPNSLTITANFTQTNISDIITDFNVTIGEEKPNIPGIATNHTQPTTTSNIIMNSTVTTATTRNTMTTIITDSSATNQTTDSSATIETKQTTIHYIPTESSTTFKTKPTTIVDTVTDSSATTGTKATSISDNTITKSSTTIETKSTTIVDAGTDSSATTETKTTSIPDNTTTKSSTTIETKETSLPDGVTDFSASIETMQTTTISDSTSQSSTTVETKETTLHDAITDSTAPIETKQPTISDISTQSSTTVETKETSIPNIATQSSTTFEIKETTLHDAVSDSTAPIETKPTTILGAVTDSSAIVDTEQTTLPDIATDSDVTIETSERPISPIVTGSDVTIETSHSTDTTEIKQTSIPDFVTDSGVTTGRMETTMPNRSTESSQTDILTTVTDSSVTTETYETDYLPDYPADVRIIDRSFFPNSDLTESSYSTLDETNDTMLDDASLGYFNSISQALLYDIIDPRFYNDEEAYNELINSVSLDDETSDTVSKRDAEHSRHRRGLFSKIKSAFKAVAKVVATVAKVVKEVATVIKTAIFGGNYEKSTTINFTIGPSEAFDIYTFDIEGGAGIKLTCEECQVQESLNVYAKFYFRKDGILTVMDTGFVQVNGKVFVKAVAGLFVTLEEELEKSIALASLPITPIIVPGVFSVGPTITLEVGAFIKLEGSVGISFGAYFTWNNIHVKINVKSPLTSEFSGLLPDKIEPKLEFKTEIELALGVFIQPQIEFSLIVLNNVIRAAIGFATKFIAGGKIGYDFESEECSGGLSLSPYLKFELNVFAEIGVASFKEIEQEYTIYEKETPFPFLKEYCFGGQSTDDTSGNYNFNKKLLIN